MRGFRTNERFLAEIADIAKLDVLEVLARGDGQGVTGLEDVHALLNGQEGRLATRSVARVAALCADEVFRTVRDTRHLYPRIHVRGVTAAKRRQSC